MNFACGDAETGKLGSQRFRVKSRMDGIARPRVIESEVEQSARGQARACAAESDARGRQRPKIDGRAQRWGFGVIRQERRPRAA
jgi:hypothetical protein